MQIQQNSSFINTEYNKKHLLYVRVLTLLLFISSLLDSIGASVITSFMDKAKLISLVVLIIYGCVYAFINFSSIYDLIFILVLLFLTCTYKFSYFSALLLAFAIPLMMLTPCEVLDVYKYVIIGQLVVCFICGLLGFTPMYNVQDGVITFGFVNENSFGMLLAVLCLLFFFKNGTFKFRKANLLFFALTILIESLLIHDDTAIVMFVMFWIIILLNSTRFFKDNLILKTIYTVLPAFLCVLAFYVGFHYSVVGSNWLNLLNNIATARPYIWNYYLTIQPLKLFKNYFVLDKNINYGAFDGAYVYLGFFEGLIMLSIIVVGLCLANYRLIKNNQYSSLTFMLIFEVAGFSENVLINQSQSFALAFAILAFYKGWLDKRQVVIRDNISKLETSEFR